MEHAFELLINRGNYQRKGDRKLWGGTVSIFAGCMICASCSAGYWCSWWVCLILSGHRHQDFLRREGNIPWGFESAPEPFELPPVSISLLHLALVSCHNVISCYLVHCWTMSISNRIWGRSCWIHMAETPACRGVAAGEACGEVQVFTLEAVKPQQISAHQSIS